MPTDTTPDEHGVAFWVGVALGGVIVLAGVRGLLHDRALTKPADLGRWLLGAGIAHDAVLAPVVVAVGLATRFVPAAARVAVRLGLAASALLLLVTWPLVHAYGVRAANPSLLSRDYGRNVTVALGVVWLAVAGAVVRRRSATR